MFNKDMKHKYNTALMCSASDSWYDPGWMPGACRSPPTLDKEERKLNERLMGWDKEQGEIINPLTDDLNKLV